MERLTKYAIPKAGRGIPAKRPCFSRGIVKNDCPTFFLYKVKKCEHIKNRECPYLRVMDKLAAYEDAMPLARVQELAQAEKDGRLVVLQNGVTLRYLQDEYRKAKHMADERLPSPDYTTGCIAGFGAGVIYILDKILTREEAEAALKKREEGAT